MFTSEKVVSLMQRHYTDAAVAEAELGVWIKCDNKEVKVKQDSKLMMYISTEPNFNSHTRSVFLDKTDHVASVDGYIMFCNKPIVCVYIDSCTYANSLEISQPQFYCNKYITDGSKLFKTLRNDIEVTFKPITGFTGTVVNIIPMSNVDLLEVSQESIKVLYLIKDELASKLNDSSYDLVCAHKESVYATRG